MWSAEPGPTRPQPEPGSQPMPKRRFDKLDPALRGRILKAAALEFGTHGYTDASLNHIVEQAGISKGSMYYYFEDKADLFAMVLADLKQRSAQLIPFSLDTLTAENYWQTVRAAGHAWLRLATENPWVQGFMGLFSEMLRHAPTEGPLVAWHAHMEQRANDLIRRGQELGVVRCDLPLPLLSELMHGVQMVQGRWLMKHLAAVPQAERDPLTEQMIDVLRRILRPHGSDGEGSRSTPSITDPERAYIESTG